MVLVNIVHSVYRVHCVYKKGYPDLLPDYRLYLTKIIDNLIKKQIKETGGMDEIQNCTNNVDGNNIQFISPHFRREL